MKVIVLQKLSSDVGGPVEFDFGVISVEPAFNSHSKMLVCCQRSRLVDYEVSSKSFYVKMYRWLILFQ